MRESLYRKKFKINKADYQRMLYLQQNKCFICDENESKRNKDGTMKALAVDHDHKTGRVRKLLCTRCNKLLGIVNDDPQLLLRAIQYLRGN